MSLNDTPSSERIQIGFFGKTNAGKSSLVNAITGQNTALVSEVRGTTTDPVKKAMELLPLGPVLLIDTPGLDDESELGKQRIEKTTEILSRIHAAVIVIDGKEEITTAEERLLTKLGERKLPYLVVFNKSDLLPEKERDDSVFGRRMKFFKDKGFQGEAICVSARTGENIPLLKEKLAGLFHASTGEKRLVADLLESGDHVVLVVPIDKAAPKGRLILPQQQTIRDILDAGCTLSVCQVPELAATLEMLKQKPKLVITDSQVFGQVKELVPEDVKLTSFSILLARYKGNLKRVVEGARMLSKLKDGDKVLISEGCTHHRQCGDIGTEKLPKWILEFTGKKISFEFTSGEQFPAELSPYALVIHCGACMLNEKQMAERGKRAAKAGIPMTNYGIAIANMQGILDRSIEIFDLNKDA